MSATRVKNKAKKTSKTKASTSKNKPVANDKIFNIHHPEYNSMIEFAFEAEGIKYYCFSKDTDMRYGRYIFLQTFIQEVDLRISLTDLKKQNELMTGWLDGSKKEVNHGKVLELLSIQRQQCGLAFEPETVYRLSSCLFFDETEDLRKWDKAYNEQKIARWKESHTVDFFFHRLMQEFVNLKNISPTVLQNYLNSVPETLKGWRLVTDILSRWCRIISIKNLKK